MIVAVAVALAVAVAVAVRCNGVLLALSEIIGVMPVMCSHCSLGVLKICKQNRTQPNVAERIWVSATRTSLDTRIEKRGRINLIPVEICRAVQRKRRVAALIVHALELWQDRKCANVSPRHAQHVLLVHTSKIATPKHQIAEWSGWKHRHPLQCNSSRTTANKALLCGPRTIEREITQIKNTQNITQTSY